jgi:sulfite reductase alpha subunit-like flavoprotein
VYTRILALSSETSEPFQVHKVQPLNTLSTVPVTSNDFICIIASTTGHGDIPQNGHQFAQTLEKNTHSLEKVPFTIFGNGSSLFPGTYNAASKKLHTLLRASGALSMGLTFGDTATEDPPWSTFESWWESSVKNVISGSRDPCQLNPIAETVLSLGNWETCVVESTQIWPTRGTAPSIERVSLQLGEIESPSMGYISVLPPNPPALVQRILDSLSVSGNEVLDIQGHPTCRDYLLQCVDLTRSFYVAEKHLYWQNIIEVGVFNAVGSFIDALMSLVPMWKDRTNLTELCSSLPTILPRIFSTASAKDFSSYGDNTVDILVQTRLGGIFSDQFLGSLTLNQPVELRYKFHGISFRSILHHQR